MSYTDQHSIPDPDEFLLLRFGNGDIAAFEQLVHKYQKPVICFASRALGDRTEAEDIAQNVFVRAFRKSNQFRFDARFSTWLYAIARNLCRNELRRRARHPLDSLDWEEAECTLWLFDNSGQGLAEAIIHTERLESIDGALAALPERQRTALLLLKDEDMSYQDIAGALNISLPATKALLHRGRQALKRSLTKAKWLD